MQQNFQGEEKGYGRRKIFDGYEFFRLLTIDFFLYLLLLYYFASDSIVGMKTGIQQNVMKSTDRNYILLIIPELLVGMPLTF